MPAIEIGMIAPSDAAWASRWSSPSQRTSSGTMITPPPTPRRPDSVPPSTPTATIGPAVRLSTDGAAVPAMDPLDMALDPTRRQRLDLDQGPRVPREDLEPAFGHDHGVDRRGGEPLDLVEQDGLEVR